MNEKPNCLLNGHGINDKGICIYCGKSPAEFDTLMASLNTNLLLVSINHISAIIELASQIVSAGPLKRSGYQRVTKEFKRIHKLDNDQYDDLIKKLEKELTNAGS